MQELTLGVIRLGLLAVLWLFVLAAVRVIRTDLFGPSQPRPPLPTPEVVAVAPRRNRSAAGRLVVTSGPLAGTVVGLEDSPITLGRAEGCTLVLGDDYVSNEHARLLPLGDRWVVEDLGSTNGTFLSDTKVTGPTPVPLGAPIRVGRTVLELQR